MNRSGDQIGGTFAIVDPTTGALSAADDSPLAVLSINGVDSAAVVTVTTTGTTGRYAWTCTLPAGIADGDALAIWIAAEVGGVSGGNNVWHGVGVTRRPADVYALEAAQRVIDQTTTPWQLVLKDRDTDAELLRYDLQDENGDAIDSIATFVAEQTTPA